MKNNISLIVHVPFIVLLLSSCAKEQEVRTSIPPADLKVYRQIRQFREQLQSGLKNGPVMSADSARWYIETTLNLTYGSASYVYEEMNLDTIQVQIPVTDGMVSFAEVQQAYEVLLAGIKAQYHGLNAESKQFIYCNLKPSENLLKNGSETWELVSGVGAGPVNLFNFGPNDYWIWWNDNPASSGICSGPAYPGGYGSDAAKEIQKKVHLRKGVPPGNYYYSDLEVKNPKEWDYPNLQDPNPGDNIMESYIYYSFNDPNGPNPWHSCLPPDEMNFYLYGAERIIYNAPPVGEKPFGKSFVSLYMQGDILLGNPSAYYNTYLHHMYITYGILHFSPDPPEDL